MQHRRLPVALRPKFSVFFDQATHIVQRVEGACSIGNFPIVVTIVTTLRCFLLLVYEMCNVVVTHSVCVKKSLLLCQLVELYSLFFVIWSKIWTFVNYFVIA